jgi:maltose alpha-D-glucosyltransferase/alpha-amylase
LSWVSAAYLDAYLRGIGAAEIVPKDREELALLLNAHLLNRALYEVQYDLNNRPAWVRVPLEGILQVLGTRVLVT